MKIHQRFFEVSRQYENMKEVQKRLRAEMEEMMSEIGIGTYLQDPETGAVYKIVQPNGTYVEYRKIGYDRTALPHELRGSLSKKEAEEAGFQIPKKS
jgi:hypothetical protein